MEAALRRGIALEKADLAEGKHKGCRHQNRKFKSYPAIVTQVSPGDFIGNSRGHEKHGPTPTQQFPTAFFKIEAVAHNFFDQWPALPLAGGHNTANTRFTTVGFILKMASSFSSRLSTPMGITRAAINKVMGFGR